MLHGEAIWASLRTLQLKGRRLNNPAPGFLTNHKEITIEPLGRPVTVSANGMIVASSSRAKLLRETPYAPVIYIPFEDIDFSKLAASDHTTHCPYKGHASYWSVTPAGETGRNAMWAYRTPYDEMVEIIDHAAFYPSRVTISIG